MLPTSVQVCLTADVIERNKIHYGAITKVATLPMMPFPGLFIGAEEVESVAVNQGKESDDIEVRLRPIIKQVAEMRVIGDGWQWL